MLRMGTPSEWSGAYVISIHVNRPWAVRGANSAQNDNAGIEAIGRGIGGVSVQDGFRGVGVDLEEV